MKCVFEHVTHFYTFFLHFLPGGADKRFVEVSTVNHRIHFVCVCLCLGVCVCVWRYPELCFFQISSTKRHRLS